MAYKGWKYSFDEEDYGDVRKLEHFATHEDGRIVELDFSPYNRSVKTISLEAMVELDFPRRCDMVNNTRPVYEEDLLELYITHLKRRHEGNRKWKTEHRKSWLRLARKLSIIPNTKLNPATT